MNLEQTERRGAILAVPLRLSLLTLGQMPGARTSGTRPELPATQAGLAAPPNHGLAGAVSQASGQRGPCCAPVSR